MVQSSVLLGRKALSILPPGYRAKATFSLSSLPLTAAESCLSQCRQGLENAREEKGGPES